MSSNLLKRSFAGLILLSCLCMETDAASLRDVRSYGCIFSSAMFQDRVSCGGEYDCMSFLPVDSFVSEIGTDYRDISSCKLYAVANLGFEWPAYKRRKLNVNTVFDADFFCVSTYPSAMRLREAHADFDFALSKASALSLKFGQSVHPLAADKPQTLAYYTASPFNPFNYSPQISVLYSLSGKFSVGLDAVWQSEYASSGPSGVTADYASWSCFPEAVLHLSFHTGQSELKAGADLYSIRPRNWTSYRGFWVRSHERFTALSPFVYANLSLGGFRLQAKSILNSGGEHLGLIGGYALHRMGTNVDNGWYYTPFRTTSSWIDLSVGRKVRTSLFIGYEQNLGTSDSIISSDYIYYREDVWNLVRLAKLSPSLSYVRGPLTIGAEYDFCVAEYGEPSGLNLSSGILSGPTHLVHCNRASLVLKCAF